MAKYKILVGVLIILNCFVSTSYASEPDKKFYVTLNIGRAFPLKFNGKDYPVKKKLKSSMLQSIGIGYKLSNNLRIDVGATKFNNFSYHATEEAYNSIYESHQVWKYRQKISPTLFAASIYYDMMNYKNFTPFATIGIGASRNSSQYFTGKYYSKDNFYDNKERTKLYVNSDKKTITQFAWNIGVGLAYKAGKSMHLDLLTYKYHDLGKVRSGIVYDSFGSGPTLKTSLKTHSTYTGVRINF